MKLSRRSILAMMTSAPLWTAAQTARARSAEIWSARQTFDALEADTLRLLDIRSRAEWRETGLARGAWPISLHEKRFAQRLMAARDLAGGRTVALICATGGRSASVMQAVRQAGYTGFVDVSEGMLGSRAGPGWIAAGLPVVSLDAALKALPRDLA